MESWIQNTQTAQPSMSAASQIEGAILEEMITDVAVSGYMRWAQ